MFNCLKVIALFNEYASNAKLIWLISWAFLANLKQDVVFWYVITKNSKIFTLISIFNEQLHITFP